MTPLQPPAARCQYDQLNDVDSQDRVKSRIPSSCSPCHPDVGRSRSARTPTDIFPNNRTPGRLPRRWTYGGLSGATRVSAIVSKLQRTSHHGNDTPRRVAVAAGDCCGEGVLPALLEDRSGRSPRHRPRRSRNAERPARTQPPFAHLHPHRAGAAARPCHAQICRAQLFALAVNFLLPRLPPSYRAPDSVSLRRQQRNSVHLSKRSWPAPHARRLGQRDQRADLILPGGTQKLWTTE